MSNPDLGRYYVVGWIDSAEPVATKGPNANTRVRWHVDYYLTGEYWRFESLRQSQPSRLLYSVGRGRLKRGPSTLARPDPSAPRKWIYDTALDLHRSGDNDGPYVIVYFTKNGGTQQDPITIFTIGYWGLQQQTVGQYATISLMSIYAGLLEESMGLDPDAILGVWFSPIPPKTPSAGSIHHHINPQGIDVGWYEMVPGLESPETFHNVLITPIETTDGEKWIVVDPMGTVYGNLPWGMTADRYVLSVDVGTNGAWLIVDLKNGAVAPELGEGRRMQIPLISAPITSNELSSYVLSGQQQYDRTMAVIQQDQNLKSGVANAGTGALGGAIGGSMVAPGIGTVVGAIGGLATSLLGTYFGTEIQKEADNKSQQATETLMSNQAANVIISGGGSNWYHTYQGRWHLVKMTRDAESAAELALEQSELGYVTDSYSDDCSTVVATGGGLRIEGLEVKGDIPPEGRAYIAALFARGVHLDLIQ